MYSTPPRISKVFWATVNDCQWSLAMGEMYTLLSLGLQ